ncbi:O-acetyltransferase OatA [Halioglobus japonicus]|nr:O-acetyltransferase OatA [Halioglobus japonicus]
MQQSVKRKDIEGLRALAVLSVILFHLDFSFIPGGFLGVDVFFVISGYLISRNILSDLGKRQFSFRKFYARRARRLLPALFATLIFTLLLSFLLFPPDHSFRLAIVALLSVFSLSNFLFWSELGYFDSAAHLKPLLHTWSLAVEEQFYIVWPAFLAIFYSARKHSVFWPAIFIVAILSLLLAQAVQGADPGAAFFLTPFRIFEFCIGAMVVRFPSALAQKRFFSGLFLLLGLFILVLSFLNFDDTTPMPGFLSLIPCIATALIIYAANDNVAGKLLTNKLMVYTGAISYSLYLVHWPVIVFFKYQFGTELDYLEKGGLLLSFFVLAALMYRYIETPLRSNSRSGSTRSARGFTPIIVAALLIFLVSGQAIYTKGWRFRLPEAISAIPSADEMWRERNAVTRVGECFLMKTQSFSEFNQSTCLNKEPQGQNYLILGDSFAADTYSILSTAYPDVNFLQATAEACSPFGGVGQYETCERLVDFILSDFLPDDRIDGVILSSSWSYDELPLLKQAIQYLYSKTEKVIVVGSGIRFVSSVPSLIVDSGESSISGMEAYANNHIVSSEREGNRLLKSAVEPLAPFIDYQQYQCPGSCRIFTEDGKLAFIDYGHLSLSGGIELAGKMADDYRYLFIAHPGN